MGPGLSLQGEGLPVPLEKQPHQIPKEIGQHSLLKSSLSIYCPAQIREMNVLTMKQPIITLLAVAIALAVYRAEPVQLKDKTLVAWVAPANLTQQGGSVLTIEDDQAHFDGILFGEIAPAKWMPGS